MIKYDSAGEPPGASNEAQLRRDIEVLLASHEPWVMLSQGREVPPEIARGRLLPVWRSLQETTRTIYKLYTTGWTAILRSRVP